jgi:hypothetical protein
VAGLGLIAGRGKKFFSSQWHQMGTGPTQPHIQWVLGALSLGIKWPGHEAHHSPPSSAEVKSEAFLPLPNAFSWSGA